MSRTANFTSYTGPRFDAEDQQRLQRIVIALARRGCSVVLSNSTADQIAELYERNPEAHAAGLRAIRVPARRAINSNAARRGPVEEFLIANVPELPEELARGCNALWLQAARSRTRPSPDNQAAAAECWVIQIGRAAEAGGPCRAVLLWACPYRESGGIGRRAGLRIR